MNIASVLAARDAAPDAPHEIARDGGKAEEQDVAVAQFDSIVMVVRVADFPEHVGVPVRLQHRAALPRLPADEATGFFQHLAIVDEYPVRCQVAIQTGRVRHPPRMRHVALEIEEIDIAVVGHRRIQRVAGAVPLRVARPQPDARALAFDLLHMRHCRLQ